MKTVVVVHYDEVGIKGRNRSVFEQGLQNALHFALHGLPSRRIKRLPGRIRVAFEEPLTKDQTAEARERLRRVFGVAYFAVAAHLPADLEAVERRMLDDLQDLEFSTFGLIVRRTDKTLPFTSEEVARRLGAAVVRATGKKVDLASPDLPVHIDLMAGESYLYYGKVPGPGGLPLDARNKVVALISGGIDSPVAAYRLMKRGCLPVFLHFHGAPALGEMSIHKVKGLVRRLCDHRCRPILYLAPLAVHQRRMLTAVHPMFLLLLYRRLMLRVAEGVAEREGALALVTGESLGQVASQTLKNQRAVQAVATLPILRPLIGMDKREIVDEARAIGTYELSIEPHDDCCSFLLPRNPATNAEIGELDAAEANLPVEQWTQEILDETQRVRLP